MNGVNLIADTNTIILFQSGNDKLTNFLDNKVIYISFITAIIAATSVYFNLPILTLDINFSKVKALHVIEFNY